MCHSGLSRTLPITRLNQETAVAPSVLTETVREVRGWAEDATRQLQPTALWCISARS
jgi:hypothetical protein